jgi:hypothetical protein
MMKVEAFNQHHQIARKERAASVLPAMQGSVKHVTRHLGSASIDARRLGTADQIPREEKYCYFLLSAAQLLLSRPHPLNLIEVKVGVGVGV